LENNQLKRKRRGNSRFFILFLLIAFTLSALSYGLVQVMKKISWFDVSKIEVTGNRFLDNKFLTDIAHDYIGKNLIAFSKKDLAKKYLAIKRIQKVKISKVLPNKLKISIVERRSIVYVKTVEGNLFPIDGEKIVLDNRPTPNLEDMPVVNTAYQNTQMVVGRNLISKYLEKVIWLQKTILAMNPDFEKCISEYYMKDGLLYFVETTTGAKIILGDKELPTRIRRFMFLKENGSFEKNSVYDFRFEDQVVVRKEAV
jgi:cell division protein FtsQ